MRASADIYSGLGDPAALPEVRMLQIACSGLAAQAVHAFASLGLPDLLKADPLPTSELAARTRTEPALLFRLLRFLGTIDVVAPVGDQAFRLTQLGRTLCTHPRPAIRNASLLMGSEFYRAAVGGLLQQIRTGENAFAAAHGMNLFSYLAKNHAAEERFSDVMSSSTELGVGAILALYDFANCRQIVDVGGGKGAFLRAVLNKHPAVTGILYDSEAVVRDVAVDERLGSRFGQIAGDFFQSVPRGGSTYILRRVLHDWDDEKAVRILRSCRAAMDSLGRLLVIEMSPHHSANNWAGSDLLMMVLQDGKERTEADLRALLDATGFETVRLLQSDCPYWLFEARPS